MNAYAASYNSSARRNNAKRLDFLDAFTAVNKDYATRIEALEGQQESTSDHSNRAREYRKLSRAAFQQFSQLASNDGYIPPMTAGVFTISSCCCASLIMIPLNVSSAVSETRRYIQQTAIWHPDSKGCRANSRSWIRGRRGCKR